MNSHMDYHSILVKAQNLKYIGIKWIDKLAKYNSQDTIIEEMDDNNELDIIISLRTPSNHQYTVNQFNKVYSDHGQISQTSYDPKQLEQLNQ